MALHEDLRDSSNKLGNVKVNVSRLVAKVENHKFLLLCSVSLEEVNRIGIFFPSYFEVTQN